MSCRAKVCSEVENSLTAVFVSLGCDGVGAVFEVLSSKKPEFVLAVVAILVPALHLSPQVCDLSLFLCDFLKDFDAFYVQVLPVAFVDFAAVVGGRALLVRFVQGGQLGGDPVLLLPHSGLPLINDGLPLQVDLTVGLLGGFIAANLAILANLLQLTPRGNHVLPQAGILLLELGVEE